VPRAPRSLALLIAVLALVAAVASTASAARTPLLQNLQAQQFQALGGGTVTLDGGFSVIGWITPARRTQLRIVDRAGDAKLIVNGREITLRRRQARLNGVSGRYLVTGSRFTLEVRGAQGLQGSGVGFARFRGQGQYRITDGNTGPWRGLRILIGALPPADDDNDDDNGDSRVRGLRAEPAPTPEPAPQPAPQPAPETAAAPAATPAG
jgi:hypothetical protein